MLCRRVISVLPLRVAKLEREHLCVDGKMRDETSGIVRVHVRRLKLLLLVA